MYDSVNAPFFFFSRDVVSPCTVLRFTPLICLNIGLSIQEVISPPFFILLFMPFYLALFSISSYLAFHFKVSHLNEKLCHNFALYRRKLYGRAQHSYPPVCFCYDNGDILAFSPIFCILTFSDPKLFGLQVRFTFRICYQLRMF